MTANKTILSLNTLIVDDDKHQAKLLKIHIAETGHNAEFQTSPVEALELIKERKKQRNPFHVIFLDYVMPKIDGVELSHSIKEVSPETIIIAVTSHTLTEDKMELIQGDFDLILSKTEPLEAITMVLQNALSTIKQRMRGE